MLVPSSQLYSPNNRVFFHTLFCDLFISLTLFILIDIWKQQIKSFFLPKSVAYAYQIGLSLFFIGAWIFCFFSTVPYALFAKN
ncbi:hypothetical protein, partial [uncultured Dubosiella sp.]